jgi:dipeptide/tripeptide permease
MVLIPGYFAMFYMSINAGSLLSMIITPKLRADVKCFGMEECFPLAFGLPAILMLTATIIFVGLSSLLAPMLFPHKRKRGI